jgi:UDP-glucose 4-epimerase
MDSRRILITGLSSFLGGRLAQVLEREPGIDAVVGVDTQDPQRELERTEFVRVDTQHSRLRRIVGAASIDTVIDTRLVVDPLSVTLRTAHEINVIATRNILAACGGDGTPVRKLVFKSSAHHYGCEPDDPAFFTEEMTRPHPPRSAIERDVVQAEEAVAEFAARNPRTTTTVLRFADGLGAELSNPHLALLGLPVVPCVLGFDPRLQFIHEADIVGALEHVVRERVPGTYNAAADGVLALSEIVSLLGKRLLPVLPPYGTSLAASQLRRLGLRIPVEMLRQLRFGRGLDNRRLKATGFAYRYTSREAVLKLRAHQRLRPLLRSGAEPYHYERDVEEFLRWSPSVQSAPGRSSGHEPASSAPGPGRSGPGPASFNANGPPFPSYDDLSADEVIELVASLDGPALSALRGYEAAHRSRRSVLTALDRTLARKGAI